MNKIIAYTDGSSRGNPGPGGWGSVLIIGDKVVELGGFSAETTNNQMELQATIEAIKFCQNNYTGTEVEINTDSQYVLLGINKWVFGWEKNGWQTKQNEPVKNKEQWIELHKLNSSNNVSWNKVKGHSGDLGNERADYIATSFADNQKAELYSGSLENYSSLKSDKIYPCYLTYIDGSLKYHSSWSECQKEVDGKKGAQYKKVKSVSEEEAWLAEKGINIK